MVQQLGAGHQRFVIDGVTGKIIDHSTQPPPLECANNNSPIGMEFGQLDISFHRCEVCGDDLPPVQSYVNLCQNCQHVTFLDRQCAQFEGVYAAEHDDDPDVEYFGFWVFNLPANRAEQIRRLFGGIFESDCLAIPAFRMNHFEALYRLTKRMSSAIPELNLVTETSTDSRHRHIDVSESEACLNAEMAIRRRLLTHQEHHAVDLEVDFGLVRKKLVYVPFTFENYFCVDAVLKSVTFEKAAVTAARIKPDTKSKGGQG